MGFAMEDGKRCCMHRHYLYDCLGYGVCNLELLIRMKIYQNLGGFSSIVASIARLKMKCLPEQVDFTRFHLYFQNQTLYG